MIGSYPFDNDIVISASEGFGEFVSLEILEQKPAAISNATPKGANKL